MTDSQNTCTERFSDKEYSFLIFLKRVHVFQNMTFFK